MKKLICLLLTAAALLPLLSGCAAETALGPEELDKCGGPAVALGALTDDMVPLAALAPLAAANSSFEPTAPGTATKENSSAVIDYSNAKDGYVMVKWTGGGTPKLKVLIKGPNAGKGVYDSYQYNLRTDGKYDVLPLSDGSGKYSVGVYKNTSGTQYATVLTASLDVKLTDEFAPFLRPSQYVNYTAQSEAVKKAAEICKDAKDNLEKVEKVYTFVVTNVSYDKAKASSVKSGYLPDVDETLKTKKAFASTMRP